MEAAADLGNLNEELREAGAPGNARANSIALEVRVNATGARPSQGAEKRELFSEDTQTAVVFPDAAVILLTAAVVPGQLVFLTNKENNREVVCQVIRKRNNRPTSCYVELQFTEPQNDFWGVAFPETPENTPTDSPVNNPVQPVDDDAISAETTEEPAAEPVAAPRTEEVDSLRQEVEALREQLKALTESKRKEEEEATRKAAEAVRKAQEEADAAIAALAAKRDPAAKPLIKMNLPAASTVTPEAAEAAPPKTIPAPQPVKSSRALPTSPAKPFTPPENSRHSAERDAFEDLLPEPELDFSSAPIPGERPDDDRYSIYKPLRKKVGVRDAILVVATTLLLAGGIGFAWYKDKLPMARRNASAPAPAAAAKTAPAAKPANPATSPAKGPAATPTSSLPASAPAAAPTDAKSAEAGAAAAPIPSESPNSSAGSESVPAPPVTPTPVNQRSTALAAPSKKRKATTASAKPAPDAPEPVAADAPVLPAKLVRAAKPVYPPDAMRNFITGDVRITAEVGADGRVGKVTVISGPAALRAAAVVAMKQYEYEPATKGGKPVPSELTTTIKFWFDP